MDNNETPKTNNIKPVKPLKKKQSRTGALKTAALVVIAVVAGYAGGLVGSGNRTLSSNNIGSSEARQEIVSSEGELISEITKSVGSSVVSISVTTQGLSQGFFGPQQSESQGAGTGVIISKDGVVITNRHVIPSGTTNVSVTLSDGTILDDVEVIGRTNESDPLDIAFLKIEDTKGKDWYNKYQCHMHEFTEATCWLYFGNGSSHFKALLYSS